MALLNDNYLAIISLILKMLC